MSNKQKRKYLFGFMAIVVAFLVFITIFSLMPATVAEPATAWATFVDWNLGAVNNVLTNFTLYALLAALIFGGGYLATRGK